MALDPSRTGARSPSLVPKEVCSALAEGAPSVNHMEQIALDMGALLSNSFPELAKEADRLRGCGLVAKIRMGGALLLDAFDEKAWDVTLKHESDSIRGWGAMAIGASPSLSLKKRLLLIRPFADDSHFAVREWAWLSLRPHVVVEPEAAIDALVTWASEDSPRLRRFASEVTRPRGVWSAHISALKREPALGLPILSQLRSDESRYVQDSVGNWLNDAAKSRPEWVEKICKAWASDGDASTKRICRRGMRSLTRAATASGLESLTPVP